MAYAELTTIVAGAEESHETFTDETLMAERLNEIASDADGDGYRTDVYVLWHDHDPGDEDCSCAQYVQDHKPYATFNPNGAT